MRHPLLLVLSFLAATTLFAQRSCSEAGLQGGETLIDQGSRLVVDKQEVQVMKGA